MFTPYYWYYYYSCGGKRVAWVPSCGEKGGWVPSCGVQVLRRAR